MKPYPATLGSCQGDCQQGSQPCKTRPLCQLAMHRVTLTAAEVERREYQQAKDMPITMEDDYLSAYGKGAIVAAVVLVALIAAAVLAETA